MGDLQQSSLFRPNTTSVVAKHTLVRYGAFQTLNIEIRARLEQFCAVRAPAKVDFVPADVHRDGRFDRFLSQTGRAYNKILRLPQVFLRISGK